jgi:hypothetical protein
MGHLSIELALDFPITIYAVDNFIGTSWDPVMEEEIQRITSGEKDFYHVLLQNINECKDQFRGSIIPMYSDDFFKANHIINFAFIDSDHRSFKEFELIDKMVPQNGIIAGHDYTSNNPDTIGVTKGINIVSRSYTKLIKKASVFYMFKK